jgi:hypothetical protein
LWAVGAEVVISTDPKQEFFPIKQNEHSGIYSWMSNDLYRLLPISFTHEFHFPQSDWSAPSPQGSGDHARTPTPKLETACIMLVITAGEGAGRSAFLIHRDLYVILKSACSTLG